MGCLSKKITPAREINPQQALLLCGLLLFEIRPAAEAGIFDIVVGDLNVEPLHAACRCVVAVVLHARPLRQHHHRGFALTGAVPHVEVRRGLVGTDETLVEGLRRVGCRLLRHSGSAGRAGGCRGAYPCIFIIIGLSVTGAFRLHRSPRIGGYFVLGQYDIGCLEDGGDILQRVQHSPIALGHLLVEKRQLHGEVAHRGFLCHGILQQGFFSRGISPLRQAVSGGIRREGGIGAVVHSVRVLLIRHSQLGVVGVLEVIGDERRLRIEVAHQPYHTIGVANFAVEVIPYGFLVRRCSLHRQRSRISRRIISDIGTLRPVIPVRLLVSGLADTAGMVLRFIDITVPAVNANMGNI